MSFEPVLKENAERLEYFLKGDKYALLFCLDLLYIAHTWDDLVDQDKPVTGEQINQAFTKSLYSIPANPFFEQLRIPLQAMMYNSLCLWIESNELRLGSTDDRATAFSIMHAVVDIIHFCIIAKGGIDWAREVGVEFWRLFGVTIGELTECVGEY